MNQKRAEQPHRASSAPLLMALVAAAIVLLMMLAAVWLFGPREAPHPAKGQPLPIVDLEVLTGEGERIAGESLRGRVALINFWGPWCPPCIRELPELVAMNERYMDYDDFVMLLVSCSQNWQPGQAPAMQWREDIQNLRPATLQLLKRDGHNVATYADVRGRTRDGFTGIGSWDGYPTTLLLDREGVVREVWLGNLPGAVDEMEMRIRLLLAE